MYQLEEVLEIMEAGITSPPKDGHILVSITHNKLGYMAWRITFVDGIEKETLSWFICAFDGITKVLINQTGRLE